MSRNQAAIIARLTKERDAAYDALVKMHETAAGKMQCPQCKCTFATAERRLIGYTTQADLDFPLDYPHLGPKIAERCIPVFV